jgi:aspartate/methionine/tyrosine aminotransferase
MLRRGFARKTSQLKSFKVVDFLDAAIARQAAGQDIIRMEAGEPVFELPPRVREAARQALEGGTNRYTASLGIAPLREAIADFTNRRYGVDIDPARVIVTTGSSAALGMVSDLLLNPGDSLLLPDPGYPCNANFVYRAGAEPVRIPVTADNHFQLGPDQVREHWQDNCAGALVASPSNPTGAIIGRETLAGLHGTIAKRGGVLIVDEIYHGLTYPPAGDISILEMTDDAFVINSFSKYFAMPGWRLGWTVLPENALEPVRLMAQNFYISPPAIAQQAALAAFHPDSLALFEARRAELQARRDFLVPALRQLGFDIPHTPAGAFYIYAGIDNLATDCEQFCWEMLDKARVSFTPGTDFGDFQARRHVRFSYTEPLHRLEEAVDRLARALEN